MNNKTILVTGGAGYIGSHVCKKLYKNGYNPVTFDNLVYGHKEAVRWGDLFTGDLINESSISDAFNKYKPAAVIHFAAYAYVGESVKNPAKYYKNNFIGTFNLLEAMRSAEVKNIVFSSTCATYGIPEKTPIEENFTQNPINPYGKTKLFIEQMLKDYDNSYGIHNIALRYFNAAGADPDCETGEIHDPETHLIPLALDAASGKNNNFTIYGNDYDTQDGTCIRDYIHVDDLADAHILALEHLLNGFSSDYFNLGTGKGYSVKEIIDSIKRITGNDLPVTMGLRRDGDPPILISNYEKAQKILKWNPKYNNIDSIIQTAWNWHKSINKIK